MEERSGFYCLGMVPVFLSVRVPGYLLITERYLVSADINIYGSDIRKWKSWLVHSLQQNERKQKKEGIQPWNQGKATGRAHMARISPNAFLNLYHPI